MSPDIKVRDFPEGSSIYLYLFVEAFAMEENLYLLNMAGVRKTNGLTGLNCRETSPIRSGCLTRSSFRRGAPFFRSNRSSRTQTMFGLIVDSK